MMKTEKQIIVHKHGSILKDSVKCMAVKYQLELLFHLTLEGKQNCFS